MSVQPIRQQNRDAQRKERAGNAILDILEFTIKVDDETFQEEALRGLAKRFTKDQDVLPSEDMLILLAKINIYASCLDVSEAAEKAIKTLLKKDGRLAFSMVAPRYQEELMRDTLAYSMISIANAHDRQLHVDKHCKNGVRMFALRTLALLIEARPELALSTYNNLSLGDQLNDIIRRDQEGVAKIARSLLSLVDKVQQAPMSPKSIKKFTEAKRLTK